MRVWIFRTAGKPGGDPGTICPTTLNQKALYTGNTGRQCIIADYKGSLEYILSELFENNRLRQGWGVPTLDLRLPEPVWIENYIIASHRYWNETAGCEDASGRRNILKSMLDMKVNDVIILPNIKQKNRDERYFTVCRVNGEYYFEDRSHLHNNWNKDFGHVIPVSVISSHKYGNETLKRSIFGAPYMHAIDEVKKHYESRDGILDYINKII